MSAAPRWRVWFVLLLGGAAAPVRAAAAEPPDLQASPTSAGSIAGVVTESGSQRPLAGAQVLVVGTGIGAVTNNQGRYLLHGVPDGEAQIRVERIGYTVTTAAVTVRAGEATCCAAPSAPASRYSRCARR